MMEKLVTEAIERYSLLSAEVKCVTVALSGGADSMALLYCLLSLKEKLGIEVRAAHFNHMIRGNEAYRDESFVKEQCEIAGVELSVGRADVPLYAKENALSTELAARKLRYEFLNKVNRGVVATAHTASDNLETVIFNLSRGTGPDGLCGIPPKRDIFIRPLILCSREQIEEYCEVNRIPFVTDSTNLSDEYTRNKIRHSIIPVLKSLNPSVEKSVQRTAVLLKEDGAYLSSLADSFLADNTDENGLNALSLKNVSPAVAKRAVKRYIESVAPQCDTEMVHIESVLKIIPKGGQICLPAECIAIVRDGYLKICRNCDNIQKEKRYIVEMTETDNPFTQENKKINNLLLNNSLDCDKIVGKSVVRTRQSGDSVRLRNRGCTKTINRIFSENKIPVEERDILPVIADDNGVIWIHGIGVAERCAVNVKSKRILKISVEEI